MQAIELIRWAMQLTDEGSARIVVDLCEKLAVGVALRLGAECADAVLAVVRGQPSVRSDRYGIRAGNGLVGAQARQVRGRPEQQPSF